MGIWGIVVLAAGNSTRLGQPKQSLRFRGIGLLHNAIEQAVSAKPYSLVIVKGAVPFSEEDIPDFPVTFTTNDDWEEGVGASIRTGLTALLEIESSLDMVIFMVCDQPFITGELLRDLVEKHLETGKGIVACEYDNTIGTPALFEKRYFSLLLGLKGDEGAKKIIRQNDTDLAVVPFPLGYIDIDTYEDYQSLQAKENL